MPRFHMDTDRQADKPSQTAVWALTPNGALLGRRILARTPGAVLFLSKRIDPGHTDDPSIVCFHRLSTEMRHRFRDFSHHVFIFSTGIAVRLIAPLLDSKTTDPAVVVIDDRANHAVSLISGHLGGANELAEQMGNITGARPVITTATDINRLPSIDMIAKEAGLFIETPQNIKQINMAFLTGSSVCLHDPMDLITPLLPVQYYTNATPGTDDRDAVFCSYTTRPVPRETFVLRPIVLSVGIGCNRNTPVEVIKKFLEQTFKENHLSLNSIKHFGTSDVKRDEKGLLALSDEMRIPLHFYTRDQLNGVQGIITPSKMAQKHLGVKSVCEAAALLTTEKKDSHTPSFYQPGGELILPKQKNKDVTISVAI